MAYADIRKVFEKVISYQDDGNFDAAIKLIQLHLGMAKAGDLQISPESLAALRSNLKSVQAHLNAVNESLIDELTQIPNRRGFVKALVDRLEEVNNSQADLETAVIFLDLDGFKDLNDNCGHEVGDQALKDVAKRLQERLMRKTDVVGRLGGDEFVLFLSYDEDRHFDENTIREKIRKALDGLVYWNGSAPYPIGASIGISSFSKDNLPEGKPRDRVSFILKQADELMYADKDSKLDRLAAARSRALSSGAGALSPDHS